MHGWAGQSLVSNTGGIASVFPFRNFLFLKVEPFRIDIITVDVIAFHLCLAFGHVTSKIKNK